MNTRVFLEKAKRRLWGEIVRFSRDKIFYPLLYRSWWHSRFVKNARKVSCQSYMTAVPNPGAGIGHQMANWIAGYWFAQQFQLSFAHIPFSSDKWEALLGFGEGEVNAEDLIRLQSYRKVSLPLFDEFNSRELDQVRKIVASYDDRKVLFVLEQDQFYRDQFGVMNQIQQKFYRTPVSQHERLVFLERNFNIAIHVRRGDIVTGQASDGNTNLTMRWQNQSYFENVLASVLRMKKFQKPVKIHVFSQGEREEFATFEKLGDVEYCLDMGPHESFLHMVHADLLITSKSSFSYKPALLSKGIKVCPQNFWHGYPEGIDWILANDEGLLDDVAMRKLASI